uniref:Uncharacterized protein n=1 Tax=Schistosoma curassoni TaxID=6186 RepID=A0A183KZE0_9TREM
MSNLKRSASNAATTFVDGFWYTYLSIFNTRFFRKMIVVCADIWSHGFFCGTTKYSRHIYLYIKHFRMNNLGFVKCCLMEPMFSALCTILFEY